MTILIKRNEDRNYDRLFRAIEAATMFGRAASVSERQTPKGYAVAFKYLDQSVTDFIAEHPADFEIID